MVDCGVLAPCLGPKYCFQFAERAVELEIAFRFETDFIDLIDNSTATWPRLPKYRHPVNRPLASSLKTSSASTEHSRGCGW